MKEEAMQREQSIDLLKILACFGVVGLHTIQGGLGLVNLIVWIWGTISIPVFFTVNGYLIFRHDAIKWSYILRKIAKILIVCFSWEMLHAIAYFLYYHEIRNFVESFVLDFFQEGLFYHFWFFGALIIVYLFAPALRKLLEYSEKLYCCLMLIFGLICIGIDIYTAISKNDITGQVSQNLRMWLWIFYFMLGGFLSTKKGQIKKLNRGKLSEVALIALSLILLISWRVFLANSIYGTYGGSSIYGSLPVMLSVTGLVCAFISLCGGGQHISSFAGLTMGIYIFHPFLLSIVVHFFPIVLEVWWINILYWIFVITGSAVCAWVISKIPLIRELIKI